MRQGKSIECGSLTPAERQSATLSRWPQTGDVTSIAYTFDASVVSQQQRNWIYDNYGKQVKLSVTSADSQYYVNAMLNAWKKSCHGLVNFVYEAAPKADFRGIVIIQCDNMDKIVGFMRPTLNQTSGEFIKAQVCIPSNAGNHSEAALFSLSTISHELGHALGFKHLHEIPSVATRLRQISQGRACSVMPYLANITASDKNLCRTADNCLGSSFAVTPGLLDEQLCYNYRRNFTNKVLTITTDKPSSTAVSLSSTLWSASSIVGEQALYGFLSNLKQRDTRLLSPVYAKLATMLITRGTMTGLGLLDPLSTLAFSVLEIAALFCDEKAAHGVLLLRFVLSLIFLLNLLYAVFIDQNPGLLMAGFVAIGFIAYFSYQASLQSGQWLARRVNEYTSPQPQVKSSSFFSFFRHEPAEPDWEQGYDLSRPQLI